ncbi:hypothetical protein [Aquibacillus saliphilus]|nr:hypothetical protein [Aquibacillus saliphilus]
MAIHEENLLVRGGIPKRVSTKASPKRDVANLVLSLSCKEQ